MELPLAEDFNYWKTGKSTPDVWLDKAEALIEYNGGETFLRAIGKMGENRAFLFEFAFKPDRFRVVWPVLPTKSGDVKAAERQAATSLFYDIKAKVLKMAIFGARTAFFDFLMLNDGRTASQLTNSDLLDYVPLMLRQPAEHQNISK